MKKAIKILTRIFICAILLCGILILWDKYRDSVNQARALSIKEAIRNAAVQCYATEGVYPSSFDYLAEHYGLMIDTKIFIVDYQCYSSNQLPVIKVLVR